MTTFLCSLFVGIEYGILIGVCINLFFVLYASARPKLNIQTDHYLQEDIGVIKITPKDTLYFPAAEFLRDTVLESERNVVVVLNGKYIRNMDVTVARVSVFLILKLFRYIY